MDFRSLGIMSAIVAAALGLGLLAGSVARTAAPVALAPTTMQATSTPVSSSSSPPTSSVSTRHPSAATSSRPRAAVSQKTAAAPLPASAPAVTAADLDTAAATLRNALVNIICNSFSSALPSISGSGVFIDPRGFILTNAHIAQYFLFADTHDYPVSCVIRTGSPAATAYRADLAYLSPSWVAQNAGTIGEPHPSGTGEFDYALLAVTRSASADPLPASFPFVPLEGAEPSLAEPVVIGSYAAQFLSSADIQSALPATLVFGSVKAVYTFATTSVDVISLGGSAAAQEGSSGGGVIDGTGRLAGLITTSTVEGSTAERDLAAITPAYIMRDYLMQTGTTFSTLLANSPTATIAVFAPRIAGLEAILKADLAH